jgi:hypothetical protein
MVTIIYIYIYIYIYKGKQIQMVYKEKVELHGLNENGEYGTP